MVTGNTNTADLFPGQGDYPDIRGNFHVRLFRDGIVRVDTAAFEEMMLSLSGKTAGTRNAGRLPVCDPPEVRQKIEEHLQTMVKRFEENGVRELTARQLRSMIRGIRQSMGMPMQFPIMKRLDADIVFFRDQIARGLPYASMHAADEGLGTQEFVLQTESLVHGGPFAAAFTEYIRALPPNEREAVILDEDAYMGFLRDHQSCGRRKQAGGPRSFTQRQGAQGVLGEHMLQQLLKNFLSRLRDHGSTMRLLHTEAGSLPLNDGLHLVPTVGHNFEIRENDGKSSLAEFDAVVEADRHGKMLLFDAKTGHGGTGKQTRRWRELSLRLPGVEKICTRFIPQGGFFQHFRDGRLVHTLTLGLRSFLPKLKEKLTQAPFNKKTL